MSVARIAMFTLPLVMLKKGLRIAAAVKLPRSKLRVHEVLYLLDRFVLGELVRVGNRDFFRDVVVYLLLNDAVEGFHLL
jgi:hypothetical protein